METIYFKGTEEELRAIVDKDQITLIDFHATWCAPCKMLSPVLDQLAAEREDVQVIKIDIDENEAVKEAYDVMGVPTMVFFDNGEEMKRLNGFKPLAALLDELPEA